MIKLLDGLRLDEKSTASLLLAAGNRYEMSLIQDAIKVQYPAGMSITGLPRGRPDLRRRAASSSASTARSSASASTRSSRSVRSAKRWSQWSADWHNEGEDDEGEDPNLDDIPEDEEPDNDEDAQDDDDAQAQDGYHYDEANNGDFGDEHEDQAENNEEWDPQVTSTLLAAAQALTVTSKQLAGLAQARGFYNVDKGKGKKGKAKGKGRGKKGLQTKPKGQSKGSSKSKTGKGKGAGDSSAALRQSRLNGSTCLGCGSPDHWLKDCPSHTVQNAQLATAGFGDFSLDAEGMVNSAWMVQSHDPEDAEEKECECFALPALHEFTEEHLAVEIPKQPAVLLRYATGDNSAFIIADTGCQTQVAGKEWRARKAQEILPLQAPKFPDKCRFSFGPGAPLSSVGRYVYPVAIAGKAFAMCISEVDAKAPALMSRRAFESLGAVPDVHLGQVYFRAMDRVAQLWLSACGHLAIRLDDWGNASFSRPPKHLPKNLPNVVSDEAFDCPSALQPITAPANPEVRAYGAGGGLRIKIAMPTGKLVPATPKESPSAKTPLNLSEATMQALRNKPVPGGQGLRHPPPPPGYPDSSRRSSISSPASAPSRAAPPTRSVNFASQAQAKVQGQTDRG